MVTLGLSQLLEIQLTGEDRAEIEENRAYLNRCHLEFLEQVLLHARQHMPHQDAFDRARAASFLPPGEPVAITHVPIYHVPNFVAVGISAPIYIAGRDPH